MTTIDTSFVDDCVARIGAAQGSVVELLLAVQEHYRYLPAEALHRVCELTEITPAQIAGTSSFYAQFRFHRPGDHTIKVCLGTACHIRGGERIAESIERELGIKLGQTTDDFRYTLETVACIGACALAPTVVIDNEVQRKMTPQKVVELLSRKDKRKDNAS